MFGDTVENQFIGLEGFESVFVDRVGRTNDPFARFAKRSNIIDPRCGREKHHGYDDHGYRQ
jgi:hypothetical protein